MKQNQVNATMFTYFEKYASEKNIDYLVGNQ